MFHPQVWKVDSKNGKRGETLLHYYISNNFKASLAFLLCQKRPYVQDMIFVKNSAGKTPLMVSLTSLDHYSGNFSSKIWELMAEDSRVQDHLKTMDVLQACAENGRNELLLKIASTMNKRNVLKQTAGGRTVLDLCSNSEDVFKILQLVMPLNDIEEDLSKIKDTEKGKNLLQHWSSKNFYEVIDFFRRAVSTATFKQMLEEKSKNGTTP